MKQVSGQESKSAAKSRFVNFANTLKSSVYNVAILLLESIKKFFSRTWRWIKPVKFSTIVNLMTVLVATLSLYIAYCTLQFSVNAAKPQISIMDQRGYASRVPEKKYYLGKNSYFIYNLPLFRVEIKNTGQRTACNFKLKSRAIFFKSSLIYTLDSAQWANPIFQGQSRNISDAIVVPSNDKNDFYYQLSLFWYDSLINSKDSISVTYHCLLRRDSGYDLFGTTEAELERLGNLKSFTIVGRDTSATEAITNYYLPRNIR